MVLFITPVLPPTKQNSQDMTNGECYAARVNTPVKLNTGALQHKVQIERVIIILMTTQHDHYCWGYNKRLTEFTRKKERKRSICDKYFESIAIH